MDDAEEVTADVCVVGAGVAGAIVADACRAAGRHVLIVEAGPRVAGRDLRLRALERIARSYNGPRMKIWHRHHRYRGSDFQSRGPQEYSLATLAVIARGGSTLGWTGFAYRMMPEDFRLRSRTGLGADWPISYDELEPFYVLAERTLRVRGDGSDLGHPPRSEPFPVPARPFHRRDRPFLAALADRTVMHHNSAHASDGGAFTADELLDVIEQDPLVEILTHTTVQRLDATTRRVESAEAVHRDTGRRVRIRAEDYVLCTSGIETPTLLLESTGRACPEGLGNRGLQVGRHLVSHAGVTVRTNVKGARWRNGPIEPTAASRAFDTADEQARGKFVLLWRPTPDGSMTLNACVEQLPHPDNAVVRGVGRTHFGTAKPYLHFSQDEAHRRRIDEVGSLLRDLARDMASGDADPVSTYVHAHPMCTTRMSADPMQGVVDAGLRVHGTSNLYVCGSSVFPTGAAAHPTLTVAALAHRLGRHLGPDLSPAGSRGEHVAEPDPASASAGRP